MSGQTSSRTSRSHSKTPSRTSAPVKPGVAKPNPRPIIHFKEMPDPSHFATAGFDDKTGGRRRRSKSQKRNRKQRRRTRRH